MNVTINMVPPAEMRYQTVGDWQVKGDTLVVTVAKSGDDRTDMLVGIHEIIEAVLFLDGGGKEADVDAFDLAYEGDGEPGDSPRAPYHQEHVLATIIERLMCRDFGMTWEKHEDNIERADAAVEKALKARKP